MSDRLCRLKGDWMKNWQRPVIEHMKPTSWQWIVSHPENLEMGTCVDIGAFTFLHARYGKIRLGDYCAIGSHSVLYTRDDTTNTEGDITIESGAYIPGHTIILPGVTVGEDAIIGSHSLIKRDIPPREVWGGVPARFLKKIEDVRRR